jgi:regulatory protein
LEEIDEPAYRSILLSLLEKKKRTLRGKDEQDVYDRLLRFAVGRGFENKEIICCLRQLFKESDYAGDWE